MATTPLSKGLQSRKHKRSLDDKFSLRRKRKAVALAVQHGKSSSSRPRIRRSSSSSRMASDVSLTMGSSSTYNKALSSRRHEVGEEIWEEEDVPQLEMLRSIDTLISKETEPADNGWETCETDAEQEEIALEPEKVGKSAFTSPREKERQPSEPEPEGESSGHPEMFQLPSQVEDLDTDIGNHRISITALLREDDTGNSKAKEKEAAEERESKNVDQDNDNKASDDEDGDELGESEANEPDVSSGDTAEEGERPEIILETTDGESNISTANKTDELCGDLAGLETETVPMNSDDPTLASRQEEVCEPAVEYYTVQWERRQRSKGLPRRRDQITRRRGVTSAQAAAWYDLEPLAAVKYMGDTYGRGDNVYIYTGDGDLAPARIHEIREFGDGRNVISVLWYYSKEETEAFGIDMVRWPVGRTHILTNWLQVTMWDTLNGLADGVDMKVSNEVVLDVCHPPGSICSRSDPLVSWIHASTRTRNP